MATQLIRQNISHKQSTNSIDMVFRLTGQNNMKLSQLEFSINPLTRQNN